MYQSGLQFRTEQSPSIATEIWRIWEKIWAGRETNTTRCCGWSFRGSHILEAFETDWQCKNYIILYLKKMMMMHLFHPFCLMLMSCVGVFPYMFMCLLSRRSMTTVLTGKKKKKTFFKLGWKNSLEQNNKETTKRREKDREASEMRGVVSSDFKSFVISSGWFCCFWLLYITVLERSW